MPAVVVVGLLGGAITPMLSVNGLSRLAVILASAIATLVMVKVAIQHRSFAGAVLSLVFTVGTLRYLLLPAYVNVPALTAGEGLVFAASVLLGAGTGRYVGNRLGARPVGRGPNEAASDTTLIVPILCIVVSAMWFAARLVFGAYNAGEGSSLEGLLRIATTGTVGLSLAMRSRFASKAAGVSILVLVAGTVMTGFVGAALAVALLGCFWVAYLRPLAGRPHRVAAGFLVMILLLLSTTNVVKAGRDIALGEGRQFSPADVALDPLQIDTKGAARRLELATAHRLAVERRPPSLLSQDLGDLILAPILVAFLPESLWRSRPALNQGRLLSSELHGLPSTTISSSTAGWLAEAKLASGYIGVGAVSAFLATILSIAAQMLGRIWRVSNAGVWVVASFHLIDFESPLIPWMAGLLRSLAMVTVLSLVVATVRRGARPLFYTRGESPRGAARGTTRPESASSGGR